MNIEKCAHGKTHITVTRPWGLNLRCGQRLLCSDGVIRAAELAETADTFFSVPAKIWLKGKSVSGYMTVHEESWIKGVKEQEPFRRAYVFRHHDGQPLPKWPDSGNKEFNDLLQKAYETNP